MPCSCRPACCNIAVRSDQCRAGIASELLHEADEFYTAHGYTVGPVATPFCIKLGDRLMVFQLEQTQSRWFVKIAGQPKHRRLSFTG